MQSNTGLNAANVQIEKVGSNKIRFTKTDGLELNLDFTSGFGDLGFGAQSTNVDSVWADLSYEADDSTPKGSITEGALWYNSDLKIEILKAGYNGNTWFGKTCMVRRHRWSFIKRTTITFRYAQLVKMVHHHYNRK